MITLNISNINIYIKDLESLKEFLKESNGFPDGPLEESLGKILRSDTVDATRPEVEDTDPERAGLEKSETVQPLDECGMQNVEAVEEVVNKLSKIVQVLQSQVIEPGNSDQWKLFSKAFQLRDSVSEINNDNKKVPPRALVPVLSHLYKMYKLFKGNKRKGVIEYGKY